MKVGSEDGHLGSRILEEPVPLVRADDALAPAQPRMAGELGSSIQIRAGSHDTYLTPDVVSASGGASAIGLQLAPAGEHLRQTFAFVCPFTLPPTRSWYQRHSVRRVPKSDAPWKPTHPP
jgi:hypothetical protein